MKKYVWQYLNSTVSSLFRNQGGQESLTVGEEFFPEVSEIQAGGKLFINKALYTLSGKIVTVSINFNIALFAQSSGASFGISMPIPSTTDYIIGVGTHGDLTANYATIFRFEPDNKGGIKIGVGCENEGQLLTNCNVILQYKID